MSQSQRFWIPGCKTRCGIVLSMAVMSFVRVAAALVAAPATAGGGRGARSS